MEADSLEPEILHSFKNQLGLALGFCNLVLDEVADTDPHRADLLQIQDALQAALKLLPQVAAWTK